MSINQPVNNRKEYEKFYSKEIKSFFIKLEEAAYDIVVDKITVEFFTLIALENENTFLYKSLNSFLTKDAIKKIYSEIYDIIVKPLTVLSDNRVVPFTPTMMSYLKKSNNERQMLNHKLITTDHVLLSILSEENIISSIFKRNEVTYGLYKNLVTDMHEIADVINEVPEYDTKIITFTMNEDGSFEQTKEDGAVSLMEDFKKALRDNIGMIPKDSKESKKSNEYCTDMIALAETGKIDKISGRDGEISKIIEILNRRKNNNVVIVGDSGSGKSAIVDGLALKIANEEVPVVMQDKKLWKLNIGSMVSGTQFRGMFEDRIDKLVKKLRSSNNNILFIDDIHLAYHSNSKNSDYDIIGMLGEILTDGSVQVIITTNHKGYRTIFEMNSNFSSKFQKLIINKVSRDECFSILKRIKDEYEKHHNVKYSDEILMLCIDLADKYVNDRALPTSAIDLMDEVGSHCFLRESFPVTLSEMKEVKNDIKKEIKEAMKRDDMDSVSMLETKIDEINENIAKVNGGKWAYIERGFEITTEDVYSVVSANTGVPISKITIGEKDKLKKIDENLKKYVIGQDDAIEKICRVIKRNKLGISMHNKPIGSYLLVGSTGVGKTFLAKKIAEEVFGDEKYLIRFDMSEYADKTSVNKLIGSSAGYVGYDDGGLLTEAVKKQKYAVLLIDEIEKANEEIFNIFLQVLDEGVLTDNTGKKIDFKNTIIILTSNIGTKSASQEKFIGFDDRKDEKYKYVIERELKNKFPPEFINRLDDVIYFNTLTKENLLKIIDKEIEKCKKNIEENGYTVQVGDNIAEYIYKIIEPDVEYGARPINRAIQREIENKIVDLILDDDNKKDFLIKIEDSNLIVL